MITRIPKMGKSGRVPSVLAGLVVLGADPKADIRNARRIVAVFREGERHER